MRNSSNHKFAIYLIYGLILLAFFSRIQVEYFDSTLGHGTIDGFWYNFHVAFSGPILLVAGLMLLSKYANYLHKLFGIISLIGGVYWAIELYEALASF